MKLNDVKYAFIWDSTQSKGEILEAPEYTFISDDKRTLFEMLKHWRYEQLYKNRDIKLVTFKIDKISEIEK
jgi:hypothetical protein